MTSLTNHQRACLGLSPVDASWRLLALPRSKYDVYDTYAFVDDTAKTIRKVILEADMYLDSFFFHEYDVNEVLSDDGEYILPKTAKGKPVKLTAATLNKKPGVGVYLSCYGGNMVVGNYTTQQSYWHNGYDKDADAYDSQEAFRQWMDIWCAETTQNDLIDVQAFAARQRVNVKCGEGDFFRFKLNRRLYGYGRIVLDIRAMRKAGVKFWDCYMGKPLIAGVYHVVTDNPRLTPDDLRDLPMLPAGAIMDNVFYYGEYPIIGHEPINEDTVTVDYPVNYSESCQLGDHRMFYQCGRFYREKPRDKKDIPSATYAGYANTAIGWKLPCVSLPILEACIRKGSNQPYWDMNPPAWTDQDLRNPKNRMIHNRIRRQFGLPEIKE